MRTKISSVVTDGAVEKIFHSCGCGGGIHTCQSSQGRQSGVRAGGCRCFWAVHTIARAVIASLLWTQLHSVSHLSIPTGASETDLWLFLSFGIYYLHCTGTSLNAYVHLLHPVFVTVTVWLYYLYITYYMIISIIWLLPLLFYKFRNWGSERLGDFAWIAQLVMEPEIGTLAFSDSGDKAPTCL